MQALVTVTGAGIGAGSDNDFLVFILTFIKIDKNAIGRIVRRHEEINALFSTAPIYAEALQIGSGSGSGLR